MTTKLSLFFLMFAIIGNAPEVVQGARRPINLLGPKVGLQYPDVAIAQAQARAWNWGCNFCWLCHFPLYAIMPLDYKTCYDKCVKYNC